MSVGSPVVRALFFGARLLVAPEPWRNVMRRDVRYSQPMRTTRKHRTAVALSGVVAAAVALGGCSSAEDNATDDTPQTSGMENLGGNLSEPPSDHIHGVDLNPADGQLYLATHDGLFHFADGEWQRKGPVIDLMGFTAAGPDHFYASGHPGPGADLPNPVGLIESRDGGTTWAPLSRQGESDFHALTATSGTIAGFDGQLRISSDGETWTAQDIPTPAFSLALSQNGDTLIATTERGPLISRDRGASWSPIEGAPLMVLVDGAGASTVVGITPDGTVHVSEDAGASWEERGAAQTQLHALGAAMHDDQLSIHVAGPDAVLASTDGGHSFGPVTD